jgi:hypothetical protein
MYTGVCSISTNQAEQTKRDGKNQRSIVYARFKSFLIEIMDPRVENVNRWVLSVTGRAIPRQGVYIPQPYTEEWWKWREFELSTLVPEILNTMNHYEQELGMPIETVAQLEQLAPAEVARYRAMINSGIPPA